MTMSEANAGAVVNAGAATAGDVTAVIPVLESYSKRGIFRTFSASQIAPGKVRAKLLWHYNRSYQITADGDRALLRISSLLPQVPSNSAMFHNFRTFVEGFGSAETVPHRRLDPLKARIKAENVGDNATFLIKVMDGDYAYAAQKLTNIAHEVFLAFLPDGPYWEYRIDVLGLDPDSM
jgi:hypothetical protein